MNKMALNILDEVRKFKKKYPMTIAWRLKKNSYIAGKYINDDEKLLFAFAAQKNNNHFDIMSTAIVALTDKRLLIARKRVVFGYFLTSITPDMFNDIKVLSGVFWGKIHLDTLNEYITLSNIDKKALPEIETKISSYMMEEKKRLNVQK